MPTVIVSSARDRLLPSIQEGARLLRLIPGSVSQGGRTGVQSGGVERVRRGGEGGEGGRGWGGPEERWRGQGGVERARRGGEGEEGARQLQCIRLGGATDGRNGIVFPWS